jgi:hypothetical protein
MPFDFLDDVFLLYLPLKAAQGIFEGFSLLQSDFCQLNYTPKLVLMGRTFIARFCIQVKRYCDLGPDSPFVLIMCAPFRLSNSRSIHQSQSQSQLAGRVSTIHFHKIGRNLILGWK